MPTYIDYHEKLPPIPTEAAQRMVANLKAGKRDAHGVKPLNVFLGRGESWCLTDAPDSAAVVASHKAQGFSLRRGEVHEVNALV